MNEKQIGLIIVLLSYIFSFNLGLLSYIIMEKFISINVEIDYNISQLIKIFISNVISTIAIWLIGVYLDTASIYDPYWSVQTPYIFICLLIKFKNVNAGNIIYLLLILFWAIRLTYNYTKTFNDISYIDWRYKQIKENTGKLYQLVNLVGICMFPTIIVYVASIPSFLFVMNNYDFDLFEIVGFIIMLISTLIEMKADIDIHNFKQIRKDKKEIINIGLWKYSRHPNYFGEICFWYGVAFSYIFNDFRNNWITIIGAILNNALFLFISIPLAEKRLKKYKEGFDEYKKNTSMLIPIKCCC
jgi:steroid 5-alpha reductase family enzyme